MIAAERLGRWIFGAAADGDAEPVVLATRPAGGRGVLVEALGALDGVRVFTSRREFVTAIESRADSGRDGLPVLVHRGRPDLGVLPARTITGDVLRLDREEILGLLEAGGTAAAEQPSRVDVLDRLTEGWIGPCLRLLPEDDPDAAIDSEAFRDWVEQEVLGPLPADVVAVLDQVAAVHEHGPVDLEAWRRSLLDQPARLAAFEALRHRWGLLVPTPDGPRLPPILARVRRGITAAAPIARALAAAAHGLDRPAIAGAWLRRAGDAAGARRLERLGDRVEVPGAVDLELLGPPVVRRVAADGTSEELDWRLRRALHLVAYLAMAPERRATRDALVASLFPDASRGAVERNFHPTISDARRSLGLGTTGGGILHQDGVYRLDPAIRWGLDRDRFVAAADQAEELAAAFDRGATEDRGLVHDALDTARRAWSLYRGPLLDGHEAAWITAARDHLHRHYLGVLRRVADLATRLDLATLALDAWRAVLVHEPFEESAHLSVMELYAEKGRRDLVRRQFVRLQDLLKELRVGPADDTVARYHALMR